MIALPAREDGEVGLGNAKSEIAVVFQVARVGVEEVLDGACFGGTDVATDAAGAEAEALETTVNLVVERPVSEEAGVLGGTGVLDVDIGHGVGVACGGAVCAVGD